MKRQKRAPKPVSGEHGDPFTSAEEAWFWAAAALMARSDGARIVAGLGLVPRPCEPEDLLKAVETLYARGRLARAHIDTLIDFGKRLVAPDSRNRTEARAARLWDEALDRLSTVWRAKGIVE